LKSSNNLLPNADVDVTNVDVDVASAPVSMDQVPKLIYGKGSVSMDQVPVPASFYTATSLAQPYDTSRHFTQQQGSYIHGRLENELKKLSLHSTPQTVVRKKMYDIGYSHTLSEPNVVRYGRALSTPSSSSAAPAIVVEEACSQAMEEACRKAIGEAIGEDCRNAMGEDCSHATDKDCSQDTEKDCSPASTVDRWALDEGL